MWVGVVSPTSGQRFRSSVDRGKHFCQFQMHHSLLKLLKIDKDTNYLVTFLYDVWWHSYWGLYQECSWAGVQGPCGCLFGLVEWLWSPREHHQGDGGGLYRGEVYPPTNLHRNRGRGGIEMVHIYKYLGGMSYLVPQADALHREGRRLIPLTWV